MNRGDRAEDWRVCKECGERKGFSCFPRKRSCKGGRSPRCKSCHTKHSNLTQAKQKSYENFLTTLHGG